MYSNTKIVVLRLYHYPWHKWLKQRYYNTQHKYQVSQPHFTNLVRFSKSILVLINTQEKICHRGSILAKSLFIIRSCWRANPSLVLYGTDENSFFLMVDRSWKNSNKQIWGEYWDHWFCCVSEMLRSVWVNSSLA